MGNVLVVGIGNAWRGDDVAGLEVAARVAARKMPGVEVICCDAPGPGLVDAFRPETPLIVVDAVLSGAPAGTLHRLDLAVPLPPGMATVSTHSFDLAAILALARALQRLPLPATLFGIEAACLTPGAGLSAEVAAALPRCVDTVEAEIDRIRAARLA